MSDRCGSFDESPFFENCQYEAIYNWVADEKSTTVVVGGPASLLKSRCFNISVKESRSRQDSSDTAKKSLPTSPIHLRMKSKAKLKLADAKRISDQGAFRNPKYPLEVALSSIILCSERWGRERRRLRVRDINMRPCKAAPNAAVGGIAKRHGSLANPAGARRLREFDVITSRRALRLLLRFLYPESTPFEQSFSIDVDLIGSTMVLTVNTQPIKSVPVGYGIDFEDRLLEKPSLHTGAVTGILPPVRPPDELTSIVVVHSMRLCGMLNIAVAAETDAIAPQFNPIKDEVPPDACCSDNAGPSCCFVQQRIGSNECLVHACEKLSLLEEQLVRGEAPLAELKSHSIRRPMPWEETADQMRLGGAKLLVKGAHDNGVVASLQLMPIECVPMREYHVERAKWQALVFLLQKLRKLADAERKSQGQRVGCLRLTYSMSKPYLVVDGRMPSTVRISPEAVDWLEGQELLPRSKVVIAGSILTIAMAALMATVFLFVYSPLVEIDGTGARQV